MKRLEGGAVERAMLDWRIVVTLVAGLVALGIHALLTMPRQEFPEFTIRQGLVVGVMPGASSTEVEQQLAKPVEEYLFSFQEVDKQKTYSVSREGQLVVFVELQEKVKGAEAPAFWAKLRHGLNEQKMQLPGQVIALVGNNDFGDTSALLLTVTADGRSPRDLQTYLEVLEGHLRRIPETSKLRRYGLQDEVIRVTVDRARLARYGVRPATVWMTLQGLGESPAAARLDADTLELPVHVGKVLRSEKELGDAILLATPGLPIAGVGPASGSHVRLRDVATITREYGHDDAFVRFNGATAVVLSVEMQPGHDITRFGRQVDAAIAAAGRELPPAVHVARVADQPRAVRTSVNHFLRDFALAIVSVILVTVLLLPLRVATVAAVTIPITVFITLGVLNLLGVELQTVSLAGLVVVLGMVVDNAIVVIDDHVERLDGGQDPWSAAWRSARELALPVFIATLAIISSYIPFTWFMTGTGGDFVSSLPVTIGVALGASMLVAMFLVPALCARFIRRGLHSAERRGPSLLDRVQGAYDWTVEQAFRRPALTVAVGVGAVLLGVALLAVVPQQLFPKVDRNQFAVEIYLPQGRPLSEVDAVVRRLEQELRADRRVTDVTAFVGSSSPRFHTLYAPAIPSRSYAQLIVNTVDDEATLELLAEGERRTANAVPEGWIRWKQLDMQATAAPIEARLSGEDPAALHAAAARLEAAARAVPGATWVRDDWGEPVQGLTVEPDPDACARLGLSPSLIQLSLATSSRQGFPVATVWEGDYPVRVVLADDPRRPASLEGFRQQYVSSPLLAAAVPLEQVATVRPGWFEEAVVRRNGERTLTVRVDVARGVLATRVQADLEREVAKLPATPGVRLTWGGEKEDSVEQYVPLTKSLGASVAMIYLLLLFQFRRHRKALVVMLTMPLSLFGAVLGLTVFRFPFGFTAFLGLISLMGIVVRNGIIFVGYAEELRERQGLSVREAALAAGKRRMRPIFLTSAAAAVGVIPLISSGSTLWGPLGALTFMGLLVSMALTLVVLPVAYWLILRGEDAAASAAPRAPGSLAAAALVLASLAAPGLARGQDAAPLSLADARALARGQSTEVRAAQAEVGAAEQTRAAARTAWFPQVTATGSAIRAKRPLLELAVPAGTLPVVDAGGAPTGQGAYFPGASFSLAEEVLSADVTVTQPIFAGGRILNGNRLASLGADVARDQAFLARRDAAVAAEERYWRLVSLGEKARTLRAYEDLLAALERQAGDAVQAGLATRSDLLAVRLKRQEAAVDRLRLESGQRLSARDLRRHLGLPDGDRLALADAAPPAPVDPASLRQEGAGRVELRLLERAVEAEGLKSRITAGEGLPTVAIGASAMHLDVSGFGARDDAVVFATVSVPLTGLWKAAHERAAGEERERAAALRLEDGRKLLALDAARSWDGLGAAFEAARAADAAVEQAQVELAEKRDQHASGLVTLSDVLEAQVKLHQAEDRRIDARVEFSLARTRYLRAMGGD